MKEVSIFIEKYIKIISKIYMQKVNLSIIQVSCNFYLISVWNAFNSILLIALMLNLGINYYTRQSCYCYISKTSSKCTSHSTFLSIFHPRLYTLTRVSNFYALPCLCVSFAAGTLLILRRSAREGKHVSSDLWGKCDTRAVVASFSHATEKIWNRKRPVREERLNIRFSFAILPV